MRARLLRGDDLAALVLAKLALDLVLLVLFIVNDRGQDARIRTIVGDVAALALLFYAQGFAHAFVTRELVSVLVAVNIVLGAVVGLYNAGVLQKRFIADSLSAANALCGALSIWFATQQRPDACVLLLVVGAGFDGLDGAAARRWGGTRFGVYSDDLADAINYAVAPGVAIACTLSGVEGTVVGVAYSALTIARLVFFTLNKSTGADPRYFAGVPSTIGGMVALCALILFPDRHAIVGLLVGVAVVLMVSFDTAYRHLGRVILGGPRARMLLAFAAGTVVIAGGFALGPRVPVAVVLALALVYGFLPQLLRFRALLAARATR